MSFLPLCLSLLDFVPPAAPASLPTLLFRIFVNLASAHNFLLHFVAALAGLIGACLLPAALVSLFFVLGQGSVIVLFRAPAANFDRGDQFEASRSSNSHEKHC